MRRLFFAGLGLLVGTGCVFAAEATREGAQDLVEQVHKFLGKPAVGDADYVEVQPQDEAYRVTIHIDRAIQRFDIPSLSFQNAEFSYLTEPLADGTWRVTDVQLPNPMVIRFGEVTASYRWEDVRFDGIYDPALGAFSRFEETFGSVDGLQTGPDTTSASHTQGVVVQGSAQSDGDGAVDVTVQQAQEDTATHHSMPMPGVDPSLGSTLEFSYGIASAEGDATIDSLEAVKLNQLWIDIVALLETATPELDNQEVKTRLTELLPIYERIEQRGSAQQLRVDTPLGVFGINDLDISLALPGIVPEGEASLSLQLAGSSYPEEMVPPWARDLVADELTLAFGLSGFNLDAAARHLISELDVDRTPPLENMHLMDAAQLALTQDGMTFSLKPSTISSPLLTIRADGQVTATMAGPDGSLNVTTTGLDDALAAALSASQDATAARLVGVLTLAQAWSKPTGDGGASFLIEMRKDGAVIVNGQMAKPPNGQPL
jgi:hypothetical protein